MEPLKKQNKWKKFFLNVYICRFLKMVDAEYFST